MGLTTTRRVRRWWTGPLIVLIVSLGATPPVSAHTGFESSNPSDGEIVDQPVIEISLTFSGAATPAGEGFVVLDPSGQIREPDEVVSVDNLTWTLRFDEPLAGGVVGVRWRVAAPDAHPIDGSFSFTVTANAPAAIAEAEPVVDDVSAPPVSSTERPPDTAKPDPPAVASDSDQASRAEAAPSTTPTIEEDTVNLESFLDTDDDVAAGASWLFRLSRTLRLIGAVGVIGGAVFAALVLRGDTHDVRAVLRWVRRAGAILILGALGSAVAQAATLRSNWSGLSSTGVWGDIAWSSFGVAIALRLVGGLLVITGARYDTRAGTGAYIQENDRAWRPSASPAALVGIALIVASFLFDGHTVSEGPRWLHATANLIHVLTAATWAGGVAMLVLVIARRERNNVATRSLQLAARFSVVATFALVAAGIAGVALSAVILDSPSELWTTPWGQLLLVKIALVSVASVGGAYNHTILVPQLDRRPDDLAVAQRFRHVVTLEAVVLLAVTLTTALLIAAAAT